MPLNLALLSNPQWLEIPLSGINFHGFKGVRAIEVRLYFDISRFFEISVSKIWSVDCISSLFHSLYSSLASHSMVYI